MCTGVEETDPSRFADLAQRIASEHHKPATNKETHNASHIHIYMTNNVTSNKDPSGGENSSETNSAGKKSDGVTSGSGGANFTSEGPSSGSEKTSSNPKETNSGSGGASTGASGGAHSCEIEADSIVVDDTNAIAEMSYKEPPLPGIYMYFYLLKICTFYLIPRVQYHIYKHQAQGQGAYKCGVAQVGIK